MNVATVKHAAIVGRKLCRGGVGRGSASRWTVDGGGGAHHPRRGASYALGERRHRRRPGYEARDDGAEDEPAMPPSSRDETVAHEHAQDRSRDPTDRDPRDGPPVDAPVLAQHHEHRQREAGDDQGPGERREHERDNRHDDEVLADPIDPCGPLPTTTNARIRLNSAAETCTVGILPRARPRRLAHREWAPSLLRPHVRMSDERARLGAHRRVAGGRGHGGHRRSRVGRRGGAQHLLHPGERRQQALRAPGSAQGSEGCPPGTTSRIFS